MNRYHWKSNFLTIRQWSVVQIAIAIYLYTVQTNKMAYVQFQDPCFPALLHVFSCDKVFRVRFEEWNIWGKRKNKMSEYRVDLKGYYTQLTSTFDNGWYWKWEVEHLEDNQWLYVGQWMLFQSVDWSSFSCSFNENLICEKYSHVDRYVIRSKPN